MPPMASVAPHSTVGRGVSLNSGISPHWASSVAGMTASINGSAYIVSPAVGVLLYNWHAMVAYALMAGFCIWLVLWGWKALRPGTGPN